MAAKSLRPALREIKKFAGPNSETLLSMTPIGKILGLGPPEQPKPVCKISPDGSSGCCCSGGSSEKAGMFP